MLRGRKIVIIYVKYAMIKVKIKQFDLSFCKCSFDGRELRILHPEATLNRTYVQLHPCIEYDIALAKRIWDRFATDARFKLFMTYPKRDFSQKEYDICNYFYVEIRQFIGDDGMASSRKLVSRMIKYHERGFVLPGCSLEMLLLISRM
jgi:hypothetical protein